MKLVQLLAKELKEWHQGVDVYAQDANGQIFPWVGTPSRDNEEWLCEGASIHQFGSWFSGEEKKPCDDHMTANVTKSQWQAEREKMNKPKWIRHRGGKCPVADDVKVLYRMRSGTITSRGEPSSILSWNHSKSGADIMAYRVIEETKDKEIEEVKKTNFGTITYKLEIDATEATQQIDSLVAKWGQIESPLKWRDEIIELEAYEEEFRREREKLICKLESEGFKLIDHAPAKCLLDEWEAMDYESFCVGDTVVCIHEESDDPIAELTIGKEYRLILDDEQICVIDDIGDPMRYCIEIGCFKLVKRA